MKNDRYIHGQKGNKNAVSDNPKSKRLVIRCTPEDKDRWQAAAGDAHLAEWVTAVLNESCAK